ncbi:MAG: hemerythrin domain-containing protein [Methanobacteriaceae archaeon]
MPINQSDVGEDFIRFHKIVTRSLKVGIENINEFLKEGAVEKSKREGFLKYVESFSSFLDGHHKVENQKVFPYFKPLLPDVPYVQLMTEHKEVEALLQEINSGVDNLRIKKDELGSLRHLKSGFGQIDHLWHSHILIEETQLYQKVGSLNINPDEMIRIKNKFSEFFQEHTGPAYLVVPFALYNLTPPDRAILVAGFPEMVTKQLVPVDWKDKWIPMKPFLLP